MILIFQNLEELHAAFPPNDAEFAEAQKIIELDGTITVKTDADKDSE